MTKTTRRFTSKNVALIGGQPSAGLAAALAGANARMQQSEAGPIAATMDVLAGMASDKTVQFHKDIAEHYRQRALKAEQQVEAFATTINELTEQVRTLALMAKQSQQPQQ